MKDSNKSDHLTINIIISGISKPIAMLLSYIYVPIVMNYLGIEKYGVWTTILTIISWVSYFDIGIGNGLRNRLTEEFNCDSRNNANKLISSSYAISIIVMTIISLLFLVIAQFIDWYKIFGINNIEENLKFVVIESVLLVAVNFVFNLCINIFYALQKAYVVSLLQVISLGINLISVLVVRQCSKPNLTLLAFIYGVSFIAVNIVASIILFYKHKELIPRLTKIDFRLGKDIIQLGFKFFVIQICALVLFATDSLMVSYLYGPTSVTLYSNVNKLYMAISGVYIAFLLPIWSSFTKYKIDKNVSKMIRTMRNMVLLMIPFIFGAIMMLFVFKQISDLWLGIHLEYSNILLLYGMLYCVLNMFCSLNAHVLNGLEVMTPSLVIAIIQAVINIPLSLLFAIVFQMESSGVLLGTVLSMAVAACVQPVFLIKKIKTLKKDSAGFIYE